MTTGIELIAVERKRQVERGFDAAHDDMHNTDDELASAAAHYAIPDRAEEFVFLYPRKWSVLWNQKGENRITDLVKAGALIAAEIDRLLRR